MEDKFFMYFSLFLGSQAFFGFLQFIVQFLVTRNDMKKTIVKRIDAVEQNQERNQAILARTHILRFADDLRNHGSDYHSEEYYRQQILDCDTYDFYCEQHPNFSNGLTVMASAFIKREFEKKFLSGGDKNEQ